MFEQVIQYLQTSGGPPPPSYLSWGWRQIRAVEYDKGSPRIMDTQDYMFVIASHSKDLPEYGRFVVEQLERNEESSLLWESDEEGWEVLFSTKETVFSTPVVRHRYRRDGWTCAEREKARRMNTLWGLGVPLVLIAESSSQYPTPAVLFNKEGVWGILGKEDAIIMLLDIYNSPSVTFESLAVFNDGDLVVLG